MPAALRVPDLASPAFKADPHPFYARLRAEAPVIRYAWVPFIPAWIVSRYDDVVTVLRDERFSKEFSVFTRFAPRTVRMMTRNLVNADPPAHTRLRTLVSKAFTPRTVERLETRVQALCDQMLDAAAGRGRMDLVRDLALPLPITVIGEMLGVPHADQPRFAAWASRVSAGSSGRLVDVVRAQSGMWSFGRYFRALVEKRRADPRDDLVTALVQAEEAGDRLDEEELLGMIGLLMFAGFETTVSLIAHGALALMRNPEERDRLSADPDLAPAAIEELLRYTCPAEYATPRTAREDVMLGGARIPQGAMVLAGLGSANRDETKFTDPDRLDLAREPNKHLALGSGIHFCLGAPLARMEGRIALTTLFRRFPGLRVEPDAEPLAWRRGLIFRGLESLPVTWSPA